MTTTPNPYGITVFVNKIDRPADSPYTQAEWDEAYDHTEIDIRSALEYDPRLDRREMLTVYQWSAGVVARVGVILTCVIAETDSRGHRCNPDPRGERCGTLYQHAIECLEDAVTPVRANGREVEPSPPSVTVAVPTVHVKYWTKEVQRVVNEVLADDLARLAALPPKPQHVQAQLTEAATPKKATR